MAIVATVESSGLWIVDHLVWLQRTYESHRWSPVDVFDIRTPYLMDLQAKKLASQMEAKEEAPPTRKRKRKEREAPSHPDVDHIRAVLASNKDLMDRCFSMSVSSEEYRRNNGPNRARVAQLHEQTGITPLKTSGENLSDALETTRIDGLTYLIPPKVRFCVDDLHNLMQMPVGPKYDVILIDPPWENKHLKRINKRPRLEGYSLMSLGQMTRHFDEIVDHLLDPLDGMIMFWSTNSLKQQEQIQQWSQKWKLPVKAKWFWLKVMAFHLCIQILFEFEESVIFTFLGDKVWSACHRACFKKLPQVSV